MSEKEPWYSGALMYALLAAALFVFACGEIHVRVRVVSTPVEGPR